MKAFLILAIFATALMAQPPTIAGVQSPAGAPPPPDKVVATVDGHDVTYGEMRALLAMAPPNTTRDPQLALQNIFIMRYLASEGDKLKLAEQSPLKEEIEFQRMNIVAGAMLNRQRETSTIAPGAVEAYYKANSEKYQQAKIKIIYIAFKPQVTSTASKPEDLARAAQEALAQAHSGTGRSEAEAKALAQEIVKKARSGANFEALVEQYSEDPSSKAAHGDYGLVKHDSTAYPEDLKKAVFALESGKISDPVRLITGFYIVWVEEKSTQPFAEVGPEVLQALRQQNLDQWFKDLNKRFTPVIKDPAAFVRSAAPNIPMPTQPGK